MKAQSPCHGKRKPIKNNNMGSKPITHRSKSPLKAGGDELLGKKTVVDAQGNRLSADDSGERTPSQPAVTETTVKPYSKKWDKSKAGGLSYAEWIKQPGNKEKEQKFVESRTETKVVQPAVEGGFNRETEYTPELTEGREADKVDTFYPWEARFARRTQRASVRDEKRRGRRAERDLNRALNKGVISQEEYDAEIGNARRMRYGQGNIAQRQIGIEGGIEGTEGFDAITSQGYQANRRNSIRTDMNRRPQGEQKAGMPVKADGSEDMSQAEYEAGGKQTVVNVAPKTSPRIQSEAKGAETLAPVNVEKPAAAQPKSDMAMAQDFDLRSIDAKAPMGSEGPATPQRKQSSQMFGEKTSGPVGGKGIETDPMASITDPAADLPIMNESYGVNIEDAVKSDMDMANEMLENDLANSAFKMKYKHSPAMMYKSSPAKMADLSGDGKITRKDVLIGRGVISKDGSPAKMWGPSKKANAGKSTGAQNIDKSTPGRPVTQNITRSAKGIVTGKLSQSSAFKMKGFGNGKK